MRKINSHAVQKDLDNKQLLDTLVAFKKGDFTVRMVHNYDGIDAKIADILNEILDIQEHNSKEIERVAKAVGTEGKLLQRVDFEGTGNWKIQGKSVNTLIEDLARPTTEIVRVIGAVAKGDLSQSIAIDAEGKELQGEFLRTAKIVNAMVKQLNSFAGEVIRVAREVGTEGKLGGQAKITGVSGTWKDLTDSVNSMASNLTAQVRNISEVTIAVANGDLSQKITVDVRGEILRLKEAINTMVDLLRSFAGEVTRVAREVGTEGKLGGQAVVPSVAGVWKDLTINVNFMAGNLTQQVRNIAEVTTAVAKGDLTRKITVDVKGEILELKNTINTMVDQLNAFSGEVTRVAREVGTEGKLGGQAAVKGVAGTWKDLTDSVNSMASNLTGQVRNIAGVTTAVAKGDLTKKITVEAKGEILELKNTINTMVDQLNAFSGEVTRVAREVGTEGKLGGQATVKGVAGTWRDLTESVNQMAANLTGQVRNIAQVTTAVATGDLSKKITVDVNGEILELKNTINTMVDQLNAFSGEVTRVAREVGTEGKLGGQATVKGVAGTWKDLTEGVNSMASNLTGQVRNIAGVTTAVAKGDLTKKITVEAKGEILELKNTINTMVDQLNAFSGEVTRVAREVGTEGKLGGQATVKGVAGNWRDLTESVNQMAANLTSQVRNIAQVTTAVATGDLSKKITVDVKGEILELKNTINTMVDQLSSFASEVTRVAREVGTEGKLAGQAKVKGVTGTWKDLTDSVNSMADNLTAQVRNIAEVTTAVARGDLSKKITVEVKGEILELKNTVNTMVDQLSSFASEVTRMAREVGTDGKLGGQADVKGVAGTWKDLTDSVNQMAANLTSQVRNIAEVTTAVARGNLSKKITVEAKGEILELKNTINTMVGQLNAFADEVTRVAREVGTEGKLGGQARVEDVSGTWKNLTDNVNQMATNLTDQVRGIVKVVTAVANGDLKQKLTVAAKGEVAVLSGTINNMTETLAIFAEQVSGVAKEVGVDGKLGGQAVVPGAAGTWMNLTDNVNQLADNLTTQVRAIAEVATAVTKGDLTRNITVQAKGEVEELKNNLNEMIRNLRDTTQTNTEQDWLKTNIAKFTLLLQGQRDLVTVAKMTLSELALLVNSQHGVFYIAEEDENGNQRLRTLASYGSKLSKRIPTHFMFGEGLVGQSAFEKQKIYLQNVPDNYIKINSGLGESKPANIIVLPIIFEGAAKGVLELASFEKFDQIHQTFLEQLTETLGFVVNTIEANSRTEVLLKQSESFARELQAQQEQLQNTNKELEEQTRLLEEQKSEVERKNQEVEGAKTTLESKAQQLAITSKYKSEFLSNMSHELRTPLNSLLILAQQLRDNPEGNLTLKQVEFARTIHSSGNDLLSLINEILDLSKIESGTVSLDISNLQLSTLQLQIERMFRHVADNKKLTFSIQLDPDLPNDILTDVKRINQVLNNLLSNSFKFTMSGSVVLSISTAINGWSPDNKKLNNAKKVIAFSVSDTGIGIPQNKLKIIFEAFQQADSGTARKFGGTGLGLAISREIAYMLGGELTLISEVDKGSVFTLYLPDKYEGETFSKKTDNTNLLDVGTAAEVIKGIKFYEPANKMEVALPAGLSDDRDIIENNDHVILIIEDDINFAKILSEIAHENGFKLIISMSGAEGIALASKYLPSAITLDLVLPDMSGWKVFDILRSDMATSHIPIHIMSVEDASEYGFHKGALSVLEKPVSKEALEGIFEKINLFINTPIKKLLVVEDNELENKQIIDSIGSDDIDIISVKTAEEALKIVEKEPIDCIVLDLTLPGMTGIQFIEKIRSNPKLQYLPIIVNTAKDLNKTEEKILAKSARTVLLKGEQSAGQLLHQANLSLHRVVASMPAAKRRIVEHIYQTESPLAGKKILVVDDDVRNIFALTTVLERYQMHVIPAESGKEALRILNKTSGISAVLMDIMMPEMDGYQTMQEIRKSKKFGKLPIIALTAKAMKGDREKCIEAGANDYISKPVNSEQLLSLIRVWLYA